MSILTEVSWSPYIVGFLIGLLSCLSIVVSQKFLGTSTTYARTAGLFEKHLLNRSIEKNSYYQKIKAKIDWQFMLVIGIIIGSFISAVLSGEFSLQFLPVTEYTAAVNSGIIARFISALLGGILLGFGSRLAGGCTSGHGISGTLQLAISSWIAVIFFFIGGIVTAFVIF